MESFAEISTGRGPDRASRHQGKPADGKACTVTGKHVILSGTGIPVPLLTTTLMSPLVGIIMGSRTDFEHMQHACATLDALGVPYETRVVSAHRTPDWMFEYASSAESRGLKVIIAAAGGAAHLPGMTASKTILPVLGVPMPVTALQGHDALLSIVQMPAGVPVGTLAIGKPGAINAAVLAAGIVALGDAGLRERLRAWRDSRRDEVLGQSLP